MSKKHRSKKDSARDKSPLVPQKEKINFNIQIKKRDDLTEKQKELIQLILDKETKVVFIQGPAGTSKTFCAIQAGLELLNDRKVSNIVYVRTIIESASKSMGALPGEAYNKMEPFLLPLLEKMDEFLFEADKQKLIKEEIIKGIPVNFLRGSSMNAQYIICDEAQNFTFKELTTAITRLGRFSKIIIVADPDQSDINGKSGFLPMFDLFNDETSRNNGIHCFSFTKEDVVRSGILRYICERIESHKKVPTEPMFPPK